VLIVDDDPSFRKGLRNLLEDEDLEIVGEALDGADALAVALHCSPDVVVMDLRMPQMDGIEATVQLTNALPLVQVIICTMDDDMWMRRRAEAAGAFAVVMKGYDGPPKMLLGVVELAWQHKQALGRSLRPQPAAAYG